MTSQDIKTKLEQETGLKFSISKGIGSMKHYTCFRSVKQKGHVPEIEFQYGRAFIKQFSEYSAFFSNRNKFYIHNSQLA